MSDFNFEFDLNEINPTKTVPNILGTANAPYRIAFIDQWPTSDEEEEGVGFVNTSANVLKAILTMHQILHSACMFGYASNVPRTGKLSSFSWGTMSAQKSLRQLRTDLLAFSPNLIVVIGDNAAEGLDLHKSTYTWRGSVFPCDNTMSPCFGYKVMLVQHPETINKKYEWMPLFIADLARAKRESLTQEYSPPRQDYDVFLSPDEIILRLQNFAKEQKPVAMDIEGYVNNITCISFSNTPHEAFIVDLINQTEYDLQRLLRAISIFCSDTSVGKVLQNFMYDSFVLAYTFGIHIRNVVGDTMLSGWEIHPELPKSLGTQTSIWTNYPYYKSDRKIDNEEVHHRYCCTDSDVTLQIHHAHLQALSVSANEHYRFNMKMLQPMLYAQLRGIKYDGEEAKLLRDQLLVKLSEIQSRIDGASLLGTTVNVASPKQVNEFLYKELGLTPQYKIEKGRRTNKLTSDVKALLTLSRKFNLPVLNDMLLWRKLDKQRQSLNMEFDTDGRVRCSYNVVGTKTGRLSCSKSAHGTGTNLTTIPKQFRNLYKADPGYEFFQCDLAGADGWTVAAHCKNLGDPTMMDDYLFGLKPAKLIALMYEKGKEVNSWSREALLEASKDIGDGWLYFSTKQVQHGSNYGLGATAMSQNIMLQSYKRNNQMINVTAATCQELQDLYLVHRYPGVKQWQNSIGYKFSNSRGNPQMSSASGHTRTFFGRKKSRTTWQEAYSQEPQINTTYATNLAILNLWEDPGNRVATVTADENSHVYKSEAGEFHCIPKSDGAKELKVGGLLIQPLHQVHDALCGQWPKALNKWAREKVKSYFQNEIDIQGNKLVIPFDGEFGPSWGEAKEKI